ncbi:MAG: lipopolysaccharide biosynthesis protein RfbH [Candidatus Omnitrophota bacterium]
MKIAARKEILRKVVEFYKSDRKASFVAGKTSIPYAGRIYDEKELKYAVDACLDFWLTAGRYADKFENKLAELLGVSYCLLTNSGSSANLLAVSALTSDKLGQRRLRPGDEVITTACGFPTTLNPIIQNNLVPVFVDVELETYNIRVDRLEGAISKKTKAICIAHTLGNPANLGEICKIVRKYRLWFIEDNSDALGSVYQGRFTGSFGHMASLSFYPAHHITTGEGGAVLTNDPVLRKILLSFRDWGRDCWCGPGYDNTCKKRFSQRFGNLPLGYDHKYVYSHIGYNLKATDIQAAIGVAQLEKLPYFIEARRHNFQYLYNRLKKFSKYFILPEATPRSQPSWFGFPICIKKNSGFGRNEIVDFLEANKIATRMLFGGNLLKQPAYEHIHCRIAGLLTNTDLVMSNLFWIGVYPGLNLAQLKYITQVFDKFFQRV